MLLLAFWCSSISQAQITTVWVEDALPAGATAAADGGDSWNWISSNPAPYSGTLAHQSGVASGEHQHYFYNAAATLSVGVGESLFAYVYLDPANPPSEVMLQWNDGGWEHRAYWGANLIPWGSDGTVSRHAMGALPAVGQWVRLEVAASVVGLEGRVLNGMAFTLYGGRATWDHAGKAGTDVVWVEDSVPAGAVAASDGDPWNWISSNPTPYSGALAHQSVLAGGEHQHYFYNAAATLSVAVGESLFAYVYLDPANPPSEVMLQWNDGSWEHRAYWGANLVGWGSDGTVSRHAMGALPAVGQWVRLEVAASVVGLEGHVLNGMAFTLYDGRATWDYAGKSSSAGPASQSISFNALANQTLGSAPFTVSATASSGLAVSFASLTTSVCTVSGNTVTLVATGTCTIRASQAGNANYSAAPNVDQSFVVTNSLQSQTIAFGALSNQTFGTAPFTISATASSGLPVSFASMTTSVCTVSGSTVTLVGAGACTIQASQAGNATYAAAPNVSQSFTVTQAAQTISFGALGSQVLGAAPFTVVATASSGLPVTFSSLTSAVCTVSGSTVTLVSAGTCTIQAAQSGNANYAAAPNVSQSFAVTNTLQSQTISFGALSNRIFGTAPFSVSATASSGLPVGFASLTALVCTVSGSIVTLVGAGTCTIQASQAGNATYAPASNVSQGFSVTQAAQTISFGALASQLLGAAPFTVNATASSGLPVSFASLTSAVCSVSASTVTLVSAGTCTLQASQAGNANYAAATNVSQSFAVTNTLQSQTITFGALSSQPFGTAPFTISAAASSGLPVSFASLTPPVCTVSGSTVTLVSAGTCTIRASQPGNATYAAAVNVDQSFTVTSASQAISFAAAVNYTTGSFPWGVAIADFNRDGKADLAVVNESDNSVSVFIGNGDGTFVPGATLATGSLPIQIVVADFNGDGKPDLAVTNIFGNSITVYLGNGNGTFGAPRTVAAGLAPFGIAAADLNGDGKIDLVVTNGSSGSIVGQTVTVLLGNGDGTFQPARAYVTGTNPLAVAIADFNGDGKLDLAVTSAANNNVSILLGNGDGTFRPQVAYAVGAYPRTVSVADFNGDGKPDLAVLNGDGNSVSILIGNGDGTFAAATSNYAVGSAPEGMTTGDFNGDGIVDIVATNAFNNVIVVLQGNGNGTFKPAISFPVGAHPIGLAAGDLNGDGKLDLVDSNYTGNTVSVLLNGPSGFTVSALTGTPQSTLINTLYSTALSAIVRDASNAASAAANVTFAAPASGASGTFLGGINTIGVTTNASGVATAPTFTANAITGAFTVTASYAGSSATFALTNTSSALNQTITLGALNNKALGTAPFALIASASSGLPVTFSSRTVSVCTVIGNTATLIAVGTCTIRAAQAGNGMYAAAPNVDQSFSVTPAPTIQYMYDAAGNLIGIQRNGSP